MTIPTWLTRSVFFLFVVLLIVNVYVFLTREWESSFSPTTYATLYYPLDIPTIQEWKVVARDSLRLDISCTANIQGWTILTNDGNVQNSRGMSPTFHIDTTFSRLNTYTLIPSPEGMCQRVKVTIRYFPKEFYASLGMDHDDVYIVRADVPCGKFQQFSVNDWVDDYAYVGEEDLATADRIVKENMGIIPGDGTLLRMEKVTAYLKRKLKNTGGVPKDDERWMNPWILYNELVNGTGKGWCTQNAQIWVFWANRAGIPTRFVFGARTEDNTIVYTGHSFAECFVREQNRWAFVDYMHGNIFITDRQGLVLNSAQLLHLNQQNAFDSTFVRLYVNAEWQRLPGITRLDTIVTVPYTFCNALIRDEFTSHSILKYRRPPNVEDVREIYSGFFKDRTFLLGNLERYFFKPQLAYSFYPTEGGTTYFIRRALALGMLSALVLWMILWFFRKRSA